VGEGVLVARAGAGVTTGGVDGYRTRHTFYLLTHPHSLQRPDSGFEVANVQLAEYVAETLHALHLLPHVIEDPLPHEDEGIIYSMKTRVPLTQ